MQLVRTAFPPTILWLDSPADLAWGCTQAWGLERCCLRTEGGKRGGTIHPDSPTPPSTPAPRGIGGRRHGSPEDQEEVSAASPVESGGGRELPPLKLGPREKRLAQAAANAAAAKDQPLRTLSGSSPLRREGSAGPPMPPASPRPLPTPPDGGLTPRPPAGGRRLPQPPLDQKPKAQ